MNQAMLRWKKWWAIGMVLLLSVPLLAACGKGNAKEEDQERVLRIASTFDYGSNSDYLRTNFTDIFEFTHPNVKLEFVPLQEDGYQYKQLNPGERPKDPLDLLREVMDGANPPDLIISNGDEIRDLVAENRFAPLDPLITKDKLDLSEFVPAVIEGLKKLSTDGQLYALAPMFSASALIYNEQIFEDAGVGYPTDNMTWDQMFDLAKRVANPEKNIYGFSFNRYVYSDPFNDLMQYTAPLNLRVFDEAGEHMTVDTDQWANAWEKIISLVNEKVIPGQQDQQEMMKMAAGEGRPGPFSYDNFLSGRVAMTIIQNGELNDLINANKAITAGSIENMDPIRWNLVTVPTHPDNPQVGGNIWYNGVMSIAANAQNKDDAWELIKFINSEKWMQLKAESSYNLVARKQLNKPKEGLDYNIDAFFALTPVENPYNNKIFRDKPNIWQAQNIGQSKFMEALQGQKSVKQALGEWQSEGNVILQKIKENPDAPPEAVIMGKNKTSVIAR
ncbi:MAG TPA: extracellular solute-binding protein [Bacilli bacterium]